MSDVNLRTVSRAGLVAASAALSLVVAASPAWAPKYLLGAFAVGTCDLPSGDARFEGAFTATGFSADGGTLYVTGQVVGSCYDTAGDVVATVPSFVQAFPVTSVTTACNRTNAVVEVRPGAATVGAVLGSDTKDGEPIKMPLDLGGTVLDRVWSPDEPASVKARLCAVDRIAAHVPDARLAQALNALVLG